MQPPVSIVMHAHNAAVHLERSLPQMLQQDYAVFEVLVVVDSCSDLTKEKLEQLELRWPALRHIVVPTSAWHHDCHYLAMSLGVKAARYDWVMMMQPDFAPHSPNWLSRMAEGVTDNAEVVCGYCSIEEGSLAQYIYAHEQWLGMACSRVGVENSNILIKRDCWLDSTAKLSARKTACVYHPETKVMRATSYGNVWWNSHIRAVRKHNGMAGFFYRALHLLSVWMPPAIVLACVYLSVQMCWWWGVAAYLTWMLVYTILFTWFCHRVGERNFILTLWCYSLQLPLILRK